MVTRPFHLIDEPTIVPAGFHRNLRKRGQLGQKLTVGLPFVGNSQRLAGLSFFIHRDEHRELLVCVASDKLFHNAAAPPCARVLLAVYAKPRCSAFIASLSEASRAAVSGHLSVYLTKRTEVK